MDELIRRSDAIEAIAKRLAWEWEWELEADINDRVAEWLGIVPAVEPCKDAISREKLFRTFVEDNSIGHYGEFMDGSDCAFTEKEVLKTIKDAPPVTAETDIDDYMKGYDHGTADTWKIAQTVFGSTVTLYEAIDVVRCMKGADDETD